MKPEHKELKLNSDEGIPLEESKRAGAIRLEHGSSGSSHEGSKSRSNTPNRHVIRVVRTTRSPGTLGKGKPGSSMVHLQLIPPSP